MKPDTSFLLEKAEQAHEFLMKAREFLASQET